MFCCYNLVESSALDVATVSLLASRLASRLDLIVIKMASVPIEGDGFLSRGSWSGERLPFAGTKYLKNSKREEKI